MFEGLKLGAQRAIERARGWKWNDPANPTPPEKEYNALTYCTVEFVCFRQPGNVDSILDYEILDAERVTGAPDCVGRIQGKWAGYVNPTDEDCTASLERIIKGLFGWSEFIDTRSDLVKIIGPALYRSTVRLEEDESAIILTISDVQAEETPFEGKLFAFNATMLELPTEGGYAKATKNARWIKLRDLIAERGTDSSYMYWQMVVLALIRESTAVTAHDLLCLFRPGQHRLDIV
jgi:hypothetical protein